jgi:hypothetical protein
LIEFPSGVILPSNVPERQLERPALEPGRVGHNRLAILVDAVALRLEAFIGIPFNLEHQPHLALRRLERPLPLPDDVLLRQ